MYKKLWLILWWKYVHCTCNREYGYQQKLNQWECWANLLPLSSKKYFQDHFIKNLPPPYLKISSFHLHAACPFDKVPKTVWYGIFNSPLPGPYALLVWITLVMIYSNEENCFPCIMHVCYIALIKFCNISRSEVLISLLQVHKPLNGLHFRNENTSLNWHFFYSHNINIPELFLSEYYLSACVP